MKLIELIEKQKELNELIGTYPDSGSHLGMALTVKCGKVAELLGSEWRWWDVPAKCNRDELIGALTDVFKFVLVGMIDGSCLIERRLNSGCRYWDSNLAENSSVGKSEAFDALIDLTTYAYVGSINNAIEAFIVVIAYTGITRDEIEASYLAMWGKNMHRFSTKQLSI